MTRWNDLGEKMASIIMRAHHNDGSTQPPRRASSKRLLSQTIMQRSLAQRCKRYKFKAVVEFLFFVLTVFSPHVFVRSFVLPSAARRYPSSTSYRHHITAADDDDDDDGNNRAPKADHVAISLQDGISVLYESDRILAIDKPEGVPHHDGKDELGILSLLRQAQVSGGLDYQGRLFGVHRLDRVTSGILLLAKDAKMASTLTRAFRDGTVTKYYVGVSTRRRSKKKQGWVKGNMVKGRRKSWYLTRGKDDSPNMAVTRFFTSSLASFRESAVNVDIPPLTCILFRPYTGRTHQLRVAAKSVGLPLAGDPIYSDGSETNKELRTCLHASAIHLDLDDGAITMWCPPPFHHLWKDTKGNEGFNATVTQLMQKHCDCHPVLGPANTSNEA